MVRLNAWTACTLLLVGVLSACSTTAGSGSPSQSSTVLRRESHSATAPAAVRPAGERQSIAQVRVTGATSAWVWTQDMSGVGREAVLVTTDAGQSWSDVTPAGLRQQSTQAVIWGVQAVDIAHAWVITGGVSSDAAQVLLATHDSGRHWTSLGPLPHCDVQFLTPVLGWCTASRAAAGSEGVRLYRSVDGGRRWRLVSRTELPGTATKSTPGSLPFACDKAITFQTPKRGWALFTCAGGPPRLYRSSDAGATWASVTLTPPDRTTGGQGFRGTPVLAGALGAVPFTLEHPAQTLIYRTTDSGQTWRPISPPGPPRRWLAALITPSSWRLIDGRQLLSTDDAGRSWQHTTMDHDFGALSAGFGVPATGTVTFNGPTTALVNADGLWRTTDGGHHWRNLAVPGT